MDIDGVDTANNLMNDPDLKAVVINARDISETAEPSTSAFNHLRRQAALADAQNLSDAMGRILGAIGEQMNYDLKR